MKSNYTQAAAPPTQITNPGEKIFPESLASAADGSVIVGSIGTKTIFRAKPDVLEGQLAAMRGKPDPSAQPKPFQATAVPVGKP